MAQHKNILLYIVFVGLITALVTLKAHAALTIGNQLYASVLSSTETTDQSFDLWARMRGGFSLPAVDNKTVRRHEAAYRRYPKFLYRIVERSNRYLYYIVEEVERRGMPAEIALLPIVESAFNPEAVSISNAVGLWQFIPSTGESYGLAQNSWHDDRKDIVAATGAALDYLEHLHKRFRNWKLALAAYNWGENALGRSLAKNRANGLPASFHKVKMPSETWNHVNKLIAVRNIIANPADFGIKLSAIPNRPYFDKVELSQHMDKALVAKLADVSVAEFNALNPAYKKAEIRGNKSPRILLLPVDKVKIFLRRLEVYSASRMSWKLHRVRNGDNVARIAKHFKISVAQLKAINDTMKDDVLMSGQTILVPHIDATIGADTVLVRSKPIIFRQPELIASKGAMIYVVKQGDTLYDIAMRYGITANQIKSWNNIDERLTIGQALLLLQTAPTTILQTKVSS